MSDPQVPSPAPPAKRAKYKPILITLLGAVLLGAGTCFGFLSTFRINGTSGSNTDTAAGVFAIIFVASVLAFIGGVIWLLVALVRNATRNN